MDITVEIGGPIGLEGLARLCQICEEEGLAPHVYEGGKWNEVSSLETFVREVKKGCALSWRVEDFTGWLGEEGLVSCCFELGLTIKIRVEENRDAGVGPFIEWWEPGMQDMAQVAWDPHSDSVLVDVDEIAEAFEAGSDEKALAAVRALVAESRPVEVPDLTLELTRESIVRALKSQDEELRRVAFSFLPEVSGMEDETPAPTGVARESQKKKKQKKR